MVLFCPQCGNVLLLNDASGNFVFECATCPYVHNLPTSQPVGVCAMGSL